MYACAVKPYDILQAETSCYTVHTTLGIMLVEIGLTKINMELLIIKTA